MQKAAPNPDRTIRSVCASMKIEGFEVSKQTQEDCRAILTGQKSANDLVAQYLSNYTDDTYQTMYLSDEQRIELETPVEKFADRVSVEENYPYIC